MCGPYLSLSSNIWQASAYRSQAVLGVRQSLLGLIQAIV